MNDFKIGDTVRIKENAKELGESCLCGWTSEMDSSIGKFGKITRIETDGDCLVSVNFNTYCYPAKALEKINKVNDENEEIKLGVGRRYNIKYYSNGPYVFIGYKSDYGFESDCNAIFIDKNGKVDGWQIGDIKNITEHREPFKNNVVGWVGCNKSISKANSEELAESILKISASSLIFENKEDVPLCWDRSIYGRWAFEELPEPEDEK